MMSIRVFMNSGPESSATFIGLLGWLVFIPLVQLGLGRPCYGEVRGRLVDGSLLLGFVNRFKNIFFWQTLAAIAAFAAFAAFFGMVQGYDGEVLPLIIFAAGIAGLATGPLQRDLAYALNCELYYEAYELMRRVASLSVYSGVAMGVSLELLGLFALTVALGTHLALNSSLNVSLHPVSHEESTDSPASWGEWRAQIRPKAARYFGFSLNECIFYNIPLLFFTAFPSSSGIVYFGVWSKLFLTLVLPMRIYIDARMNQITQCYFEERYPETWEMLSRCWWIGLILTFLTLSVFFYSRSEIMGWVNAGSLAGDSLLFISLCCWTVGNTLQHLYGTFTVSYREGFASAYRISIITLIVVAGIIVGSLNFIGSVGIALTWSGIAYIICALMYRSHVRVATRRLG